MTKRRSFLDNDLPTRNVPHLNVEFAQPLRKQTNATATFYRKGTEVGHHPIQTNEAQQALQKACGLPQ